MRTFTIGLLFSSLVFATSACQDDGDDEPAAPSAPRSLIPQIPPPLDINAPPKTATKTASGLALKKLASNDAGAQPRRGGTAMVHYTGWRQRTGETFFTTKGSGQPMALDVEHASAAFGEALQLLHKGEKAVLWVPPSEGVAETLVYEVEVVDVVSPPEIAKRAKDEPAAVTKSASKDAPAAVTKSASKDARTGAPPSGR